MITKDGALEDLSKINVNAPVGQVLVEVGKIFIKFLATIRTNQTLTEEEKTKIREEKKVRDLQKQK